eukprot:m.387778 g.387778  ORF g.387778 m.387778 type:complete len:118 (+) comp21037_c0_seq1:2017-2370(+)
MLLLPPLRRMGSPTAALMVPMRLLKLRGLPGTQRVVEATMHQRSKRVNRATGLPAAPYTRFLHCFLLNHLECGCVCTLRCYVAEPETFAIRCATDCFRKASVVGKVSVVRTCVCHGE